MSPQVHENLRRTWFCGRSFMNSFHIFGGERERNVLYFLSNVIYRTRSFWRGVNGACLRHAKSISVVFTLKLCANTRLPSKARLRCTSCSAKKITKLVHFWKQAMNFQFKFGMMNYELKLVHLKKCELNFEHRHVESELTQHCRKRCCPRKYIAIQTCVCVCACTRVCQTIRCKVTGTNAWLAEIAGRSQRD